MSQHALPQPPGTSAATRQVSRATRLAGLLLAVWLGAAPAPLRAQGSAGATAPVPACAYADTVTADAGYDQWATTIVDTELRLPGGYAPPDLVSVGQAGIAGSGRVRALVIDDLSKMARAAKVAGVELAVISAFRSEATQGTVFAEWERQVGHEAALLASARPGHSEHQLGTTIDFTTSDGKGPWSGDFGATAQGRWLHAHASAYGFIESYPARDSPSLTCYQAEPWHFRYVGRALAKEVRASGQPLRAFLYGQRAAAAKVAVRSDAPEGPSATHPPVPATDAPAPPAVQVAREAAAQALPAVGIGVAIGIVLGRLGGALRVLWRSVPGKAQPGGGRPQRRR